MALNPFGKIPLTSEAAFDALGHEILAEKAASLGRAAERALSSVQKLHGYSGNGDERGALVKAAAEAVYAYFVQRELCGFRRHDDIVREFGIPKEVLVRLGAQ